MFNNSRSGFKDAIRQNNNLLKKGVTNFQHLCQKCSSKLFPSAKGRITSMEHKLKISESAKKRLSNYENKKHLLDRHGNKNPHFKKGVRFDSNGYVMRRDFNKEVCVHREKYEKYHKIKLTNKDYIHHIDGNPQNNDINNLVKCSPSEHALAHNSLENLAFKLVEREHIKFDNENKKYYFSENINTVVLPISLGFEDIAIEQKKIEVLSRSDISIQSEIINGIIRPTPFIASNMSTVCNSDFCILLYKLGGFGILHRAMPFDQIISDTKKIANECKDVAVSIGVEPTQFDLVKTLISCGANIVFIDIAHGFSDISLEMCKKIKRYNKNIKVVLGNTINEQAFIKSYKYIDALKVGIAQGFACETKNTAGCTEKQFSAVWKFKKFASDFGVSIISDGGIREPADVVKAIGAGAKGVMCGKIFAACPESAAEIVTINGVSKKLYAGMASRYVQEKWKGKLSNGCPEGKTTYLDIGESASDLIKRYAGALRSGISYSGATDILSFQKNVSFIRLK